MKKTLFVVIGVPVIVVISAVGLSVARVQHGVRDELRQGWPMFLNVWNGSNYQVIKVDDGMFYERSNAIARNKILNARTAAPSD